MNNDTDKYLQFAQKIKFRELPMTTVSIRSLKFQEFKIETKKRFVQAKSGFKFGFIAGGTLGLILGIPMAIKYRQISVCFTSALASGCFFSCISGIGTLIRQEDLNSAKAHKIESGFVGSQF